MQARTDKKQIILIGFGKIQQQKGQKKDHRKPKRKRKPAWPVSFQIFLLTLTVIFFHADQLYSNRPALVSGIQRTEIGASAVVGAFETLRAKSGPGAGTENFRMIHIVHIYRDTQHGGGRNEVAADMTVADGAVIGSPVVHHRINIAESAMPGQTRRKPGG